MAATALQLEPAPDDRRFTVSIAANDDEVRAAQRLRYQVFAVELGADLHSGRSGVDADAFDPFCAHLVVRDGEGQVVATTRVLTPEGAVAAGSYYAAGEFDLEPLRIAGARLLEVGRTCVHRDHRRGAALAHLWHGLARHFALDQYDWIMGCTSIPLDRALGDAYATYRSLASRHLIEPRLRVKPRLPLPLPRRGGNPAAPVPPLLLAYLRLGACIGGEPSWDPDFKVADFLVLLDPRRIEARYALHFIAR